MPCACSTIPLRRSVGLSRLDRVLARIGSCSVNNITVVSSSCTCTYGMCQSNVSLRLLQVVLVIGYLSLTKPHLPNTTLTTFPIQRKPNHRALNKASLIRDALVRLRSALQLCYGALQVRYRGDRQTCAEAQRKSRNLAAAVFHVSQGTTTNLPLLGVAMGSHRIASRIPHLPSRFLDLRRTSAQVCRSAHPNVYLPTP